MPRIISKFVIRDWNPCFYDLPLTRLCIGVWKESAETALFLCKLRQTQKIAEENSSDINFCQIMMAVLVISNIIIDMILVWLVETLPARLWGTRLQDLTVMIAVGSRPTGKASQWQILIGSHIHNESGTFERTITCSGLLWRWKYVLIWC